MTLNVGYIGLGAMGAPMLKRLAGGAPAGSVFGFDASPDVCAKVCAQAGAQPCNGISDIASVTTDDEVVGQWTHLMGVLSEDKQLRLYVNGQLVDEGEAAGLLTADPDQPLRIGVDEDTAVGTYRQPFGFTGIIDDVRVYHRALGVKEVRSRYHRQRPHSAIRLLRP